VPGGDVEQSVPTRVELGGVDPFPAAVIDLVDRRVLVGGEAELDRLRLGAEFPEGPAALHRPFAGLPPHGLRQGRVGAEDVAADPGGRHVAGSPDGFRHALSIAAPEG
jgi:hypothetical protein